MPGRCPRHEGVDVSRNGRGDAAAEQQQLAPVLFTQRRLVEQPRGPGELLVEALLANAQPANVEPSAEVLGGRRPVLPGRLEVGERADCCHEVVRVLREIPKERAVDWPDRGTILLLLGTLRGWLWCRRHPIGRACCACEAAPLEHITRAETWDRLIGLALCIQEDASSQRNSAAVARYATSAARAV